MKAKPAPDFYAPPIETDDEDVLTRCAGVNDLEMETTRRPLGILPPGAPEQRTER